MLKALNKRRQKGQSTLEYAILIIIVIAALISIQVYIKRGIMGRLKQATDDIGDQFDPNNTRARSSTVVHSETDETFIAGVTNSELTASETTDVHNYSNILEIEQTYWGED